MFISRECSSCAKDDSSSDMAESIDVNTPRTLRTCDRREEKKTFNIISKYSNKVDLNECSKKKLKTKKRANTIDNIPKNLSKKIKKESENNTPPSTTIAKVQKDRKSRTSLSSNKARKRVKSASPSVSCYSILSTSMSTSSVNENKPLTSKKFKNGDTTSSPVTSPTSTKLNKTVPVISTSKPMRKSDVNETIITKCCICNEITVNNKKLTVKCGECNNSFHLKCIDAPVKQYKGYAWMCKNCESSSSNDESSDEDENGEQETVNCSKSLISIENEAKKSHNVSSDSLTVSFCFK
jgi:hypothetical protein